MKNSWFVKNMEIRVHVFILGIWEFWWIWVVLIWIGLWVVVYACWWHVLYRLYSNFSHLGVHVGSLANLVLHGIWVCVELGIITWNWLQSSYKFDGLLVTGFTPAAQCAVWIHTGILIMWEACVNVCKHVVKKLMRVNEFICVESVLYPCIM